MGGWRCGSERVGVGVWVREGDARNGPMLLSTTYS